MININKLSVLFGLGFIFSTPILAETPMEFKGVLWESPCELAPESQGQTVLFGDRPLKDFQYPPGRSPEESFSIQLNNCTTTTLYSVVKLTFDGVRETNMGSQSDYWLRMGTGPNVGKLAVGILDVDGTSPLKLGEPHNQGAGTQLDSSTIVLNFKAVVQATPDALADQSVVAGDYSAQANFVLNYE
ncbi:minor pilin subunit PapK [Buttiauxella sp. JUb87]|uniref:fimbrial protein n=1 Tax=Buttiauxella sp. JUb87 TaxID=2485129 RepID=UPI00105BBA61|nr:fimbrial protein [Buttiauxella sp. JUb87]TDN54408.1 minor pilin subunit PapK [Buttiauxella sp. JUb87]